ncbi:DNA/RNA nuclease SfsA [Alphaproteobacteria bacterium]|nr:DNA/RNA nuclease SfsA [Alphaproteobacteria bacterium]
MIYKDIILKGTLIKRYKRFFADVKVNNETLTAYCPNTGSLKGLLDEGNEVLVAKVDNPKAKLKYRLEAIRSNNVFVGINTSLPNLIVSNSILDKKLLKEFTGTLRREVKYGVNSKIDILLEENNNKTFIEIKSVTMSREKGIAEFPDAITSRGSKHLIELSKTVNANTSCYLIYLIQRTDIKSFRIAKDIDKEYYENSLIAKKNGVKFIAYSCNVNEQGIEIEIEKEIKIIND